MGALIEGHWREEELPQETSARGEFARIDSAFRDRITADGSSGYPAEAGRYHLYVAWNCPWAHRVLIFLALKKLERAFSVAYAIPGLREHGWTFERNAEFPDCTPDEVNGFRFLHQAYAAASPRYTGKVTVPTLWDRKTRRIVNNESSEIIRMLNSEFKGIAGDDTDFYPAALRAEIDRINDFVYTKINNGVYRCGFAKSQEAYNAAWAIRRRRRTGGCFQPSCASTSHISRSSAATASASPTSRISAATCASSTACRASRRPSSRATT